jgi:hypothetical protein
MRHASLLMLVGIAAAVISVPPASATMRITGDPGGLVIDYVERFEAARASGEPAQLTRGEALREAMTTLLDGPGFVDQQGETVFTYAHPLFWAPYTIIGDGG